MEVDTGASTTMINEYTYQQCKAGLSPLLNTGMTLSTYPGEPVQVVGFMLVSVTYKSQKKKLQILMIQGQRKNLLGRYCLLELKLNWEKCSK